MHFNPLRGRISEASGHHACPILSTRSECIHLVCWLPPPLPLSVSRQLGHVAKRLCYSGNWPDAPWHSGCWRCAWLDVSAAAPHRSFSKIDRARREMEGSILHGGMKTGGISSGTFPDVGSGQAAGASMRNLDLEWRKKHRLGFIVALFWFPT